MRLALIAFLSVLVSPLVAQVRVAPGADYRVSGPYTHKNLSIYLIHGPDRIRDKTFLTLPEAMEKKLVIIHETGSVNIIIIENVGQVDIYIQSGTIIKGGKQDRTIAFDFIVPAKSGKVRIDAFCVEQGRWRQRGGESVAAFSDASENLSNKSLKVAAKSTAKQEAVWAKVAEEQTKLSSNAAVDVRSGDSPSSYRLTLDNTKIRAMADEYIAAVGKSIEGRDDVVGYAFAINGKINSADVYASQDLFRKLWPGLVKSSSVEAISELKPGPVPAAPGTDAVQAAMQNAEHGRLTEKALGDRAKMVTSDSDKAVMFETRDREQNGQWLHRNYITKD